MNTEKITKDKATEMLAKTQMCFYDTPEFIFEAIGKISIFDEMTEPDFNTMCWTAIRTVKKTRISVADVLTCYEKTANKHPELYIPD